MFYSLLLYTIQPSFVAKFGSSSSSSHCFLSRESTTRNTSCKTQSPSFLNQQQSFLNQQQHKKKNVQREYDYLLRKIDDLEFSLNRLSACYDRDSHATLKDSAARVIQSHFRSYLVRRSVSLRQLKELATIKSSFLSLKSSVSDKTHFPFEAVSREATDLLLQLDSIQGRVDPMIRDERISLSRDLVRLLHTLMVVLSKGVTLFVNLLKI